ncbi:MAG: ABC transporter ATP-binding protein/permease [Lachnospiraceae bacterium]|nr:ABC transporter ATP-binding protein/permease [Lachnospiraceae bacterium]
MSYLISDKQKRLYFVVAFVALLGSLLELLGVTAVLPFIEAIMTPEELEGKWYYDIVVNIFHPKSNISLVTIMGVAIVLIYVFKNLFLIYSSYLQNWYSSVVQRDLSIRVYNVCIRSPYPFHLNTNSSILIRSINQDVIGVFNVLYHIFRVIAEVLPCIAIGIYIVVLDPLMALCLVGLLGISIFVVFTVLKNKMKRYGKIGQRVEGKQLQHLTQSFNGIKDIMVMNRQEYFTRDFSKYCSENATNLKKSNFTDAIPKYLYEMVCLCSLIGVVVFRLHMVDDMAAFATKLAVVAVAAFRLFPSVGRLNTDMNSIVYNRPRLNSMYEMVQSIEGEKHYQNVCDKQSSEALAFTKDLKVEQVTYQYPAGEHPVFENLSMELKKGESIALIGPSGAGKTTLADVILGLLEPQAGRILLDGQDVYENLPGWAKVIGHVPQTVFLVDDTIRGNIAFGLPAEELDEEKIWRALREAQLDDFIKSLPEGLDTMVGEQGVRLSGGQRQRIAIARALYNNPEILVLDEATSALDTETENAVMESIDSLHGSKTLIIVAHRLTTIRNCDRIYEIKDGKATLRDKEEVLREVLETTHENTVSNPL